MRMLASAVLIMEVFIMGFAMLLAKDNQEPSAIVAGAVIALLMLLTPGLLKKRIGWILGGLWIAAIVVGRKGEAARAALMASQTPNP